MPIFFFHVQDGRSEPDREGTELPDYESARRHAIKHAGRILEENGHMLALGELWHMDVRDDNGLVLFRLDFHVMTSPALTHSRANEGMLL